MLSLPAVVSSKHRNEFSVAPEDRLESELRWCSGLRVSRQCLELTIALMALSAL